MTLETPDLKKSIEYFQQAIAIDPNYALGYAGVADAYVFLPGYTAGTPQDCYPKAMAAAKKLFETFQAKTPDPAVNDASLPSQCKVARGSERPVKLRFID